MSWWYFFGAVELCAATLAVVGLCLPCKILAKNERVKFRLTTGRHSVR